MKLFLVAALAASASAFTVPEVKVPAVSLYIQRLDNIKLQ